MRRLIILAVFLCWPAPASAQTAATPVILGDRAFTTAELGRFPAGVVHREWIAREAAARGIVVPEAMLAAAMTEAARQEAEHAGYVDARSPEELRAALTTGIQQELLTDALIAGAGPDPRAFERVYATLNHRLRAMTRCTKQLAKDIVCANQPTPKYACSTFGAHEICRGPGQWELVIDVYTELVDPALLLTTEPDPNPLFDRVLRYMRKHAPAARRCFYETDDWRLEIICDRRSEAAAFAYAATRVHQKAKQTWTIPATSGAL